MMLIPRSDMPEANHSWWNVSPALVIETLKLLGFPRIRCEFHHQRFNGSPASGSAGRQVSHFTVVGRRMAGESSQSRSLSVAAGTTRRWGRDIGGAGRRVDVPAS